MEVCVLEVVGGGGFVDWCVGVWEFEFFYWVLVLKIFWIGVCCWLVSVMYFYFICGVIVICVCEILIFVREGECEICICIIEGECIICVIVVEDVVIVV